MTTGLNLAVQMSKKYPEDVFITHAPGYMYVTDDKSTDITNQILKDLPDIEIFNYYRDFYAVLQTSSLEGIKKIETMMLEDPGNRWIKDIFIPGE